MLNDKNNQITDYKTDIMIQLCKLVISFSYYYKTFNMLSIFVCFFNIPILIIICKFGHQRSITL